MSRHAEAARRLGAPFKQCEGCGRLTMKRLVLVFDWSSDPMPRYRACERCAARQKKLNEDHVQRQVRETENQRLIAQDTRRMHEPSSRSYREACAAMHDEVTDILGPGWDPW